MAEARRRGGPGAPVPDPGADPPSRPTPRSLLLTLLPALAALCVACGPSRPTPGPAPEDRSPTLSPGLDADARRWVERTLAGMTVREEVAQLVIPWIPGAYASTTSPAFRELEAMVDVGVGGLSISIGLPHSYAAKLNELQRRARIPLLVTSDFENGGPGMRIAGIWALPSLLDQGGGTTFPPTMAFGAIGEERFAYEYGRITALEARAVGVQLNFAPVLDVNNNPDNPVINTRSFGGDPERVATLGSAFIRGSHAGGVMTTAKHFPGHGDTGVDSHLELPAVGADRARLDSLELVPFRRAVDGGVDAVMTAHVAVPGILGAGGYPATFSSYFLTRLLREEMAFRGLVLTDALRMGAIVNGWGDGEAAVLALEAGSDVLLAPGDVPGAVDAVVEAVRSGRLERSRIRASARRILEAKARAGLHRERLVDLERVDEVVGAGAHLAFADTAAARSITLPRDRGGLVPLPPPLRSRVLHVAFTRIDDRTGGRRARSLLGRAADTLVARRVDEAAPAPVYDTLPNGAWEARSVVAGTFVAPRSGSGEVDVSPDFARWVRSVAVHRPAVAVSYGSPYVLDAFPEVGSYLLAWGGREVSQEAGVRALLGAAPISGALPISLPPFHDLGEGLSREAWADAEGAAPAPDPLSEAGILPAGRPDVAAEEARDTAADAGRALPAVYASAAEADPASAGMSARELARLDTLIMEAVRDSASPGAALAVVRRGRLVRLRGYGRTGWGPGAPPATPTTLYDLASLTKVVGTTTAAMILVDEGRLELEAPVVRYLPWWAGDDPRKEEVTVRHLLLHRAGLPPFRRFFLEMEGRTAYRRAIGALALEYAPGSRTVYSDIGMMTLAFVVEEIAGTGLDAFLRERVWRPLGMGDTGFRPAPARLVRVAPTEVDTLYRGEHVHGVVHDENAYALGGVAGHAGLFSTAADLAVFAAAVLAGGAIEACPAGPTPPGSAAPGGDTTRAAGPRPPPGSYRTWSPSDRAACVAPWMEGGRIVADSTVRDFTRRRDSTSSRALGWDTPSEGSSAGERLTAQAFGHTGFTGTSIWIDPGLDLAVVLLTNRVNPSRDNRMHVPLRRAVHDAAARAIAERP